MIDDLEQYPATYKEAVARGWKTFGAWHKKEILDLLKINYGKLWAKFAKAYSLRTLKNVALEFKGWFFAENNVKIDFFHLRHFYSLEEFVDCLEEEERRALSKATRLPTPDRWEMTYVVFLEEYVPNSRRISREKRKCTIVTKQGIVKGKTFYADDGTVKRTNYKYIRKLRKLPKNHQRIN